MDTEDVTKLSDSECSSISDSVSDRPSPGFVKKLVSKIENVLDIPDSRVKANGKPAVPPKNFQIGDGDRSESSTKDKVSEPAERQSLGVFKYLRKSLSKSKSKPRKSSEFYSSASNESLQSDISSQCDGFTYLPADIDDELEEEEAVKCSANFAKIDSDGDGESLQDLSVVPSTPLHKSYLVACELVSSEQVYTDAIRLLNVHFRHFIESNRLGSKVKVISESDLQKVLQHFPEIQQLNEDLLLDLKNRIDNWEETPKIADVFIKKGPFLKLYGTYFQNFTTQTKFLEECCGKNVNFDILVKAFEATDICRKLTLQHFMLKPVQRIAQYKLLLEDYFKHLSEESPDYNDTEEALRIISLVLESVNNSMKVCDQVERMVQLQSMLGDFQLIQPGRELIKDGPLQKVCRKTVQDRYFILLNDCLLYATPSKTYLNLHQTLSLGGMKVDYREDDVNCFTFAIYSRTKSILLCAKSESERKEWVDALVDTIDGYVSRKKSFMAQQVHNSAESFSLGKQAPLWIPDKKVTMCQQCTAEFTQLFRRHHCRACGKIYCWKCSDNLAPLQYKNYNATRVCDKCFQQLLEDFEKEEDTIKKSFKSSDEESIDHAYKELKSKFSASNHTEEPKLKKHVPRRLAEVTARDAEANLSGWLKKWNANKYKWERNWYVLKNRVLYIYGASEDVVASKSIPVLGLQVAKGYHENFDNINPDLVFQLTHQQQPPFIFMTENANITEKWISELNDATTYEDL